MDFERFQEFILQSVARPEAAVARQEEAAAQHDAASARHDAAAARHDVEIADIRDSLKSMANTVDRLVDNQVFLQESLQELERIVFRHATDPGAHNVN
jgi:hypothetical protein